MATCYGNCERCLVSYRKTTKKGRLCVMRTIKKRSR
jgi:hypothetical protein